MIDVMVMSRVACPVLIIRIAGIVLRIFPNGKSTLIENSPLVIYSKLRGEMLMLIERKILKMDLSIV